MKRIVAALVLVCLASTVNAQNKSHRALYALEAAACAASVADGITTWVGINNGAHETNPLLVDRGTGRISWGKLIGYKAIFCGAPIAISVAVHRLPVQDRNVDWAVAPMVGLSGGTYVWATVHNIRVIGDIRRERTK